MKKKCYLHIGLTKTGSTFLQNTLYNNYTLLKERGYLYPIDRTFHYRHQLCETDGGNFLSYYINIIQNSECHSAILSSEPISYLSPETYQELGNIFDLKIVVFLRSLPSWIESEQSENMINTAFWTTDERVYMYPLRKIDGHSLLVFQNLLFWVKIFGKKNFIFLNYDASKNSNTLLSDFLYAIEFPDSYKEFIPGTATNKMLCTELLYFLAHTNFLPLHKETRKFLVDELQKINKSGKFNTQYRLLSEECFGSLYPEMVKAFVYWWKDVKNIHEFGTNSFDAVQIANNFLQDTNFYKNGLESYLQRPEFPYMQLPLDVQREIFTLLPIDLQQEIRRGFPEIIYCNETPVFLPNIVYDTQLYSLLRKWNNALNSNVFSKKGKVMKICRMPFENCLLTRKGEVFPCCAHWTNRYTFGNFLEGSFDAIWHSPRAEEFRARILRGDYSLCNNREFCKCYSDDLLVDIDSIDASSKVKHIDFAHDFECNLACISCRNKMFSNSADTLAALNSKIDSFFIPLVQPVDSIRLSGQGDPLFSRHYNLLIQRIVESFPDKMFQIYTNGQYLTRNKLESLGILERIESLNISIDAASSDTYRKIRRGGSFKELVENIDFATTLKCRDQAVPMAFSFVIQRLNYKEIPQFVELAEKYQAEATFLAYIDYDGNQAKKNNVANKEHPLFFDFLRVLHSPCLADKQVLFSQIYDVIGNEYRLEAWRGSNSNMLKVFFDQLPKLHYWDGDWQYGGFSREHLQKFYDTISTLDAPNIIETGAGLTTLMFCCSSAKQVTSIAPDEKLFERIRQYATTNGIDISRLECICERSENILPELAKNKDNMYDFALIDGGHGWPSPFVDFCYINTMLNKNGYLVVDDLSLHSCGELYRLLEQQSQYSIVYENGKFAIFQKKSDCDYLPEWDKQPYIKSNSYKLSKVIDKVVPMFTAKTDEVSAQEWEQRATLLNNSRWVALGRALGIIKLNW